MRMTMPSPTLARRLLYWVVLPVITILVVLAVTSAILLRPSRLKAMTESGLTEHLNLDATVGEISVAFLPRPRISGRNLSLRVPNQPDLPPFVEIDQFWMDAGLLSAIRRHVDTVHMQGLRIAVPPGDARDDLPRSNGRGDAMSDVLVNRIVTRDAVLLFVPRNPDDDPLTFKIADLTLTDVAFDQPIPFETTLTNPVPRGLVEATGTVGPWNKTDATQTPVSGDYTFTDADLSTINGIGGTLVARGTFDGHLAAITAAGSAEVPDFSLDLGGKPIDLKTTFDAVITGTDGTTVLERVDATMGTTPLRVSGAVTNLPGPGRRHVDLEVQVTGGRIEDLIALAIDSATPVLTGDVDLTARLVLPPGETRVRDRLRVTGRFGLDDADFTAAKAQEKLQEFSRRAQGRDEDEPMARVLTDLRGRFTLASGVLALPDLTFQVPGASVALEGRYDVASGGLDFEGTLRMQASVSRAVGGFKSIFLKPFDAIFRKDGAGAVVPIKVSGTRNDPDFGVRFGRIFSGGS